MNTILRNGVLSNLRARGRTALFTLLILALTVSLTLSLGMWSYCRGTLAAMDGTYTSVALVEYMGRDYPSETAADSAARAAGEALDSGAIAALPGVERWERTDRFLAELEGYTRMGGVIPYGDYAVVEATWFSGLYTQADRETPYAYSGLISRVHYMNRGEDATLAVFDPGESGFLPQPGESYLLHVREIESPSSNRTFVVTDFVESTAAPFLRLEGEPTPEELEPFTRAADFYRWANNYVQVESSDCIAALELFHQGILALDQGRFPRPEEAGVCVLSGSTAQRMGLGLGDRVTLSALCSAPENLFALEQTGESSTLEIVGITDPDRAYDGMAWVSSAQGRADRPLFGYGLGRAVLRNRDARQTAETLAQLVPEGVQVTLYDQGYAAAARPLQAMETTALAVTIASLLGTLAVLRLFAYLFVGRQRETVAILTSLGTPAGKIRLWLLSGAGLIAAAAGAAGAVLGGVGLGSGIRRALAAAQKLYAVDLRYSEAAVGVIREMPEMDAAPLWPALAAFLTVTATALVLCLLSIAETRRQLRPRRGKLAAPAPRGGTSLRGRGAARFALLSVKRGGGRSAVVPAASFVLSLLLGVLALGTRGWGERIDQLYATVQIQGQAVSVSGRSPTGLAVSPRSVRTLWNSGLLETLDVSLPGWGFWMEGEMPPFSASAFGQESMEAWVARQPRVLPVTSLSAAPAFLGETSPAVTWMEGLDDPEGFFLAERDPIARSIRWSKNAGGVEYITVPAVASGRWLADHGISLGEEFTVDTLFTVGRAQFQGAKLRFLAAGSYAQQGPDADLYVPLSAAFSPRWLTGAEDVVTTIQRQPLVIRSEQDLQDYLISTAAFRTVRFTLRSARDLDRLRNYLEANGFSQAGRLSSDRTTLVLRDQSFTETVGSLGRYITFSEILFPVLLAAVGLLGFVISWLMVSGRRMEFAVMRGLGAGRSRVFWSFFLEQGALCLLGSALAGALLALFGGGGALAAGAFLLCYLAGCALSILLVGRTNLMDLLSERE